MIEFIKEFWQFLRVRKNIVITNYRNTGTIWNFNSFKSRVSSSTFYIHNFLVTNILGISAFFHDSAASLIKDGKIIAAAQEERFTRKNTIQVIHFIQSIMF